MADLTVRGVPDAVYEALKEVAGRNRRSLNQEVVRRLKASVRAPGTGRDAELERVRALRGRLADLPPLDDDLLDDARSRGRPCSSPTRSCWRASSCRASGRRPSSREKRRRGRPKTVYPTV